MFLPTQVTPVHGPDNFVVQRSISRTRTPQRPRFLDRVLGSHILLRPSNNHLLSRRSERRLVSSPMPSDIGPCAYQRFASHCRMTFAQCYPISRVEIQSLVMTSGP